MFLLLLGVRSLLRPRFAPAVGHQRERHRGQAVAFSIAAIALLATLTAPKAADKDTPEALALASEKVQRSIDGADIRKVIVVPDRLVNIVT